MRNLLYWLYQPYKFLFFAPFFIINSIVFGIIAVLLSVIFNPEAANFAGVFWARLNGYMTPIRVKVKGKDHVTRGRSYVIIANHQSAYDIFVLYGWIGIDFKWVMKKELKKIPGVGFGSEAVGHIFIDRSNTKSAVETIEQAKSRIQGGTSVVFFPEGTRNSSKDLLPFKKGAFRFAFDLNLPVLPVTINGTRRIMPAGTLDLKPGIAELIFHEPVEISQYNPAQMAELIDSTRKIIESGLK